MISGIEFYKICKWNLCGRYKVNFTPELVEDGDFVFINLDTIYQFIGFLDKSTFQKKINLITHNSDTSFNQDMLDKLKKYTINIYPINSIVSGVNKIPLGFSDRLCPVIESMDRSYNKSSLVYMNFNIHSGRIPERKECSDYFSKFEWVKVESNIPEVDYYNSLKNSKYSVCPIGAGLDTHRFYESIYFDTIPIVKRNDISDLHSKFPCIIVDSWSDINYDYLEHNYDNKLKELIDWKESNDWLNINYWI